MSRELILKARQVGKSYALKELEKIRSEIVSKFAIPPLLIELDHKNSKHVSGVSIDVAKVEDVRRREHEKVEQVNRMYKAAKALGFPDQVKPEFECYSVIVLVPSCFDVKNSGVVHYNSSQLFLRLKLHVDFLCNHFLSDCEKGDVPNFVLWLLVCMKLFYKKDWDGKKWVDEEVIFADYHFNQQSTFCENSQVSVLDEVTYELAKKMAEELDKEIMEAIEKSPNDWKVQKGNVIYHRINHT